MIFYFFFTFFCNLFIFHYFQITSWVTLDIWKVFNIFIYIKEEPTRCNKLVTCVGFRKKFYLPIHNYNKLIERTSNPCNKKHYSFEKYSCIAPKLKPSHQGCYILWDAFWIKNNCQLFLCLICSNKNWNNIIFLVQYQN